VLIAGVDAAYLPADEAVVAAVVLWDRLTERVVEHHVAVAARPRAYQPGNFAVREAEAIVAVLRALKRRPAAILCDAHGRAHPRRWGLACEVGAAVGLPTIGCAKTVLCGSYAQLPPDRGATAGIFDHGELIGQAVRTQTRVRPVFVSVGGSIELDEAAHLVLAAAPRFRVPEPLRHAHQRARQFAKMLLARWPATE
jgi:deoxyribonuclease V